jgi:hypothetical protein
LSVLSAGSILSVLSSRSILSLLHHNAVRNQPRQAGGT